MNAGVAMSPLVSMVLAGLLAILALALFVLPAWRNGQGRAVSLAAALAVLVFGGVVYERIGRPDLALDPGALAAAAAQRADGGMPASGQSPEAEFGAMVADLAARLAESPDDIEGWVLLGRSYMQIGQFNQAADAFGEARARIPEPNDDLDLSYAEARILGDQAALTGAAGEIVERVLANHPDDVRSLLYGGLRALALGDQEEGVARFNAILAQDIPDQLRLVVEERLTSVGAPIPPRPAAGTGAEAALAAGSSGGGGGAPGASGAEPGVAGAGAGAGLSSDTAPVGEVALRVVLDQASDAAARASAVADASALFVSARSPAGGPPLAVKRLSADALPLEITLGPDDAMLPGRDLASVGEAVVVARLSMSGNPMGGPGDWVAEMAVNAQIAADGVVELVLRAVD